MLSRRYPRYDAEVQDFLLNDPLRTARLALAIAWAGFGARDGLPVYLAHSLGGGANMALEREIARDLRTCGAAVVIRVGGASRFRVELHLPTGRLDGATSPRTCFGQCWSPCRGSGSSIPAASAILSRHELPGLLLRLRRDVLRDRLEARLHDFFPVSPSYCLLGADGRYRGPVRGPSPDPAHRYTSAEGRSIDLREWQRRWHALLSACDEITAYAPQARKSSARRSPTCLTACGLRAPSLSPCRNGSSRIPVRRPWCAGQPQRAERRARDPRARPPSLDATGDPRSIVVIGNVDASISLPARVRIHGGYDNTASRSSRAATAYVHGSCPRSGPRPIPSPRGRRWPPACRSSPSTSAHRARRCAPRPMDARALTTPMPISLCGCSRRCRRSPPTRRVGTDRVRALSQGGSPMSIGAPSYPRRGGTRPCSLSVACAPAPR
jgi:hypothetical protein